LIDVGDRLAVTTARHDPVSHQVDGHAGVDEMTHVECPWCAGEATVETAGQVGQVVCADCSIRVEIAADMTSEVIAKAA
jgi:transcription elongation factor Elf1